MPEATTTEGTEETFDPVPSCGFLFSDECLDPPVQWRLDTGPSTTEPFRAAKQVLALRMAKERGTQFRCPGKLWYDKYGSDIARSLRD